MLLMLFVMADRDLNLRLGVFHLAEAKARTAAERKATAEV